VTKPRIKVEETQTASGRQFDLKLLGGPPADAVQTELMALSESLGLPAAGGGLYDVEAQVVGGESLSYLGGLMAPPDRLEDVVAALRDRGYEVELPA
jgi:hypothetical protein